MLEKFKELILKDKTQPLVTKVPHHLAITLDGIKAYADATKISLADAYTTSFDLIKKVIRTQISWNIPILSLGVLSEQLKNEPEEFTIAVDHLKSFLSQLKKDSLLHKNKVKISVLGKWYDLPGSLVEEIKDIIELTKDYDQFFVNLCINYGGQEEILDSCKLIGRMVKADKLDPDAITKDLVKENLYSSYFLPPDLIIKTSHETIPDLLLWDISHAKIYFAKKEWPALKKSDITKAINHFRS